jgi:hypothetical protein
VSSVQIKPSKIINQQTTRWGMKVRPARIRGDEGDLVCGAVRNRQILDVVTARREQTAQYACKD